MIPRQAKAVRIRPKTVVDTKAKYGEDWPELRMACLRRDGFRCKECSIHYPPPNQHLLHADHIVSLDKGGRNIVENLKTKCVDCHDKKTNRPGFSKLFAEEIAKVKADKRKRKN